MKITKFLATLLMAFTIGTLCSCGSDDDDDGSGGGGSGSGKAPSSIRGHEFNFFYEYGGELYRSVSFFQNEDGTFGFLSYSATDMLGARLDECTKTSSNSLHLEILSTHINGDIGDYWEGSQYQDADHSYTFDLVFATDDQGIAYVTETKGALDAWGNWGIQTTEKTWYFRMDSNAKPDKKLIDAAVSGETGGDEPWEDDEDQGQDESGDIGQGGSDGTSVNDLLVDISSVYPTYLYYHVEYANPGDYTDPDDYLTAGVCYGTSPNPTVLDDTTPIETVRPNSDSYAVMNGLKPNTTYYMRPFREVGGSIKYYRETSVKTPGTDEESDVMLKLTYLYNNTIRMEYSINTEGTFKLELWTWDISNSFSPYDLGYKTKGDKGSETYRWPINWGNRRYFYLVAKNVETGMSYRSNLLYKGTD